MSRRSVCAVTVLTAVASAFSSAQSVSPVPRPPAIKVTPEDGSAAPDGYAPIPQWLGQTRAPRPAKTAPYEADTVVDGLAGAFCFSFLPDGRILVGERSGHIKIADKDGRTSEVGGLPASLFVRGGQGLFEVRADRAFATNRIARSPQTAGYISRTRCCRTAATRTPCREARAC